uniref:Uncharacterized protein n=1 Tax=Ciona intestinalis TaxID=7719 RepID=H2XMK7_CIOIN
MNKSALLILLLIGLLVLTETTNAEWGRRRNDTYRRRWGSSWDQKQTKPDALEYMDLLGDLNF